MNSFRHASFGYVSGLVLLGAASILVGCGGGGGEAGATDPAVVGEAGQTNASVGGNTMQGTGASGASAAGGTASDAAGQGDTASSVDAGGTSSGSGGKGGKGGKSGSGGTSGSAGTSSGGTSSGGTSSGDLNEDYSIEGFDEQEPTGPNHPLRNVETKIMRRDEVSLLAAVGGASGYGRVFDDASTNYAAFPGATGSDFVNDMQIFDTTSASLDDDGNDELVVVGLVADKLVVRVIDSNEGASFSGTQEFAVGTGYQHAWVRVADFDQDGRDEILVAAVSSNGVVARIYDDSAANFTLLKEVYNGAGEEIAAAVGNFDDDRAPELALLIDAGSDLLLEVFDDADSGYAVQKTLKNKETGLIRGEGLVVAGLRLEAGNFDADASDELIALADGYDTDTESGREGLFTSVIDDAKASFVQSSLHDYDRADQSSGYRNTGAWPWQTLVADSNGDGVDEIYVLARRPGHGTLEWGLEHDAFAADEGPWNAASEFVTVAGDVHGGTPATMTAAAGRTDTRGQDLVIAVHDDTSLETFSVKAAISGAVYSTQVTQLAAPVTLAPAQKTVWATGGDWDGDTLRIRYTGQKWLELTRPRPIVLMAAPPIKEGISQNSDNSGTAYGTAVTHSSETSEEYGYTDTVTLSFEVEVPVVDFISASATAEMSEEFAETNTRTSSTTYGTSYEGAYPDDIIVFSGTLCERYEYVVMGGGNTPGLIGTKMTIDVPVDSHVYKWTVSYYNDSLGTQGSPIPASLLSHTVGDPASYPHAGDLPVNVLWKSPSSVAVGQGSGTNSATIDISHETTKGATSTTTYTAGGEGGAFVHVGYSHAWNSTSAYSVTTGNQTTFQGTVGDIKERADYTQYLYSFGLFVYPATLAGGEQLQVIDYFTEGLGRGYLNK